MQAVAATLGPLPSWDFEASLPDLDNLWAPPAEVWPNDEAVTSPDTTAVVYKSVPVDSPGDLPASTDSGTACSPVQAELLNAAAARTNGGGRKHADRKLAQAREAQRRFRDRQKVVAERS